MGVEPSGTERFGNETKAEYELLIRAIQKSYFYVYNSECEDIAEEHNDWFGEGVMESVNFVPAEPLYCTSCDSNCENASYNKLTDK